MHILLSIYTVESRWLIQWLLKSKFWHQALSDNDIGCCQRHLPPLFWNAKLVLGDGEKPVLCEKNSEVRYQLQTTNFAAAANHRPPKDMANTVTIFYCLQNTATEFMYTGCRKCPWHGAESQSYHLLHLMKNKDWGRGGWSFRHLMLIASQWQLGA